LLKISQLRRARNWLEAEFNAAPLGESTSLSYFNQLSSLQAAQNKLKTLKTDRQFIELAKIMHPFLSSRPPQIQNLVKSIDPNGVRLSGDARKARQVINAWLGEDDLTPTNQQQWLDAIASAVK
jgi:hypothetical protein